MVIWSMELDRLKNNDISKKHACKINHLREWPKQEGEELGISFKDSLVLVVHQQASSPEEHLSHP